MKFHKGDWIIRIKEDWREAVVGKTYQIKEINGEGVYASLELVGFMSKFDPLLFILHPANGSPLMKALS